MQKVENAPIANIHAVAKKYAFSGDTLETQTALVPLFRGSRQVPPNLRMERR
jgi:hypothetical protein